MLSFPVRGESFPKNRSGSGKRANGCKMATADVLFGRDNVSSIQTDSSTLRLGFTVGTKMVA